MSCNCKKQKPMNNLRNVDYVNDAKIIWKDHIQGKTEYDDLDKIMIIDTYRKLYPAASGTPSIEDAVSQIKVGIEMYDVRYKR